MASSVFQRRYISGWSPDGRESIAGSCRAQTLFSCSPYARFLSNFSIQCFVLSFRLWRWPQPLLRLRQHFDSVKAQVSQTLFSNMVNCPSLFPRYLISNPWLVSRYSISRGFCYITCISLPLSYSLSFAACGALSVYRKTNNLYQ